MEQLTLPFVSDRVPESERCCTPSVPLAQPGLRARTFSLHGS